MKKTTAIVIMGVSLFAMLAIVIHVFNEITYRFDQGVSCSSQEVLICRLFSRDLMEQFDAVAQGTADRARRCGVCRAMQELTANED